MSLDKRQKEVDVFFKRHGWPYWSPLSMLARLIEEVGEFARIVNHQFGEKKKRNDEANQDLEGEMGDILYTLACFSNAHGLDMDRALANSVKKVAVRDKGRFGKKKKKGA